MKFKDIKIEIDYHVTDKYMNKKPNLLHLLEEIGYLKSKAIAFLLALPNESLISEKTKIYCTDLSHVSTQMFIYNLISNKII